MRNTAEYAVLCDMVRQQFERLVTPPQVDMSNLNLNTHAGLLAHSIATLGEEYEQLRHYQVEWFGCEYSRRLGEHNAVDRIDFVGSSRDPLTMYLGMELEFCFDSRVERSDNTFREYIMDESEKEMYHRRFGVTDDGSLSAGGMELRTVPHTLSGMRSLMEELFAEAGENVLTNPSIDRYAYSNNVGRTGGNDQPNRTEYGLHCHIGFSGIGINMHVLGACLTGFTSSLKHLVEHVAGRSDIHWGRIATTTSLRSIDSVTTDRCAVAVRDGLSTIEFRAGRGIMEFDHVVGYAELCHAMFKYVVTKYFESGSKQFVTRAGAQFSCNAYNLRNNVTEFAQNLLYSRETNKLLRHYNNIEFYNFVMARAEQYIVLPQVLDAYYVTDIGKRALGASAVEVEVETEASE